MKAKKVLCLITAAALCFGMIGCGLKSDEPSKEDTKTEDSGSGSTAAEPKEGQELTEAVTMSGEAYSGKARCTITLNPDKTVDCDLNGDEGEGTWEYSDDEDVFITVTITAKGQTMELDVTKDENGNYSAPVTSVPGMTLTGRAK